VKNGKTAKFQRNQSFYSAATSAFTILFASMMGSKIPFDRASTPGTATPSPAR
jgi:hypothetical protein